MLVDFDPNCQAGHLRPRRGGVRQGADPAAAAGGLPCPRRLGVRDRPGPGRHGLEAAGHVDAPPVGGLQAGREDGAEGGLRHLLRHPERRGLQPRTTRASARRRPTPTARTSARPSCSAIRTRASWGSPIRSRSGPTGPASTSRPDRRSASTRSPARATRSRTRTTSTRASSGGGSAIQRELARNLSVEVAYDGSYSDRIEMSIRQDYLPQQYWIPGSLNARDTAAQALLTANVTNPYTLANFAALQDDQPRAVSADVHQRVLHGDDGAAAIACCGRSRRSTT